MPVVKKTAGAVLVLNENDDGSQFFTGPGGMFLPAMNLDEAGRPYVVDGDGMTVELGGVPVRTTPVRVATFGDSTANIGSTGGPHDVRSLTSAFPASGATVLPFSGMEKLAIAYRMPVQIVGNGGVSGDSTTAMLARDLAAASSSRKATADIVALEPDVIIARCGSINDLLTVTSATLAATVDAVAGRHRALIARLTAGGATVFDEGIAGFTNGSVNTATDQAATRSAIVQLNAIYAADAAASGGRVVFIDPVGLTCDASGAYLPGVSTDGTHLNPVGAIHVGIAEEALIKRLFGIVRRRYSGVNLVSNANMAATGSVTGGTAATGFSASGTNVTRTNVAVIQRDGEVWQTADFLATASAAQAVLSLPFPIASWGFAVGDSIQAEFPFSVEAIGGGVLPLLNQILARMDITKTGNGRVVVDMLAMAQPNSLGVSRLSGRVIFPPLVLTEASAALSAASVLTLSATIATSGDSIRMAVGSPVVVRSVA